METESRRTNQPPTDTALRLWELYVSEENKYVQMGPGSRNFMPKEQGRAKALSPAVFADHLEGRYAVAVFASEAGTRFICLDVDDGQAKTVQRIMGSLTHLGIDESYIHVSFSGKKGFHVEVFFEDMVPVQDIRCLYDYVLLDTGMSPREVELRPTQGQAIKVPLGLHGQTGKRCWFVNTENFLPIERSAYLEGIRKMPMDTLQKALDSLRKKSRFHQDSEEIEENEGAPALVLLKPIQQAGTRHGISLHNAIVLRGAGYPRAECLYALQVWLRKQNAAFMNSSMQDAVKDLGGIVHWVYSREFDTGRSAKELSVSRYEMECVLCQPANKARKLYFWLMMREKAGYAAISHYWHGVRLGWSTPTVKKLLDQLTKLGGLEKKNGKTTFVEGTGYCRSTNIYRLVYPKDIPDDKASRIRFPPAELWRDFHGLYWRCLSACFSAWELTQRLEDREWSDFRLVVSDHTRETASDRADADSTQPPERKKEEPNGKLEKRTEDRAAGI